MASDPSAPVPETPPPLGSSDADILPLAKGIVEKSPAVLFRRLNDDAHRLVYVSENISRYGYSARDLLEGRFEFADIVHPEDRPRLAAEIKEYARLAQLEYTQEYRLVSPDGQVFWVQDETLAERDEHGRITHYQGIVMDITARRQAEEALRQANLIVERSPIILFRRTAGVTGLDYVSQNVSRYGYDPETLRRGTLAFLDIVHPDDHASLISQVRAARLAGKDEYALRYRIRTASGEIRWIDDVTTVDCDEHGEPRHYQGVLADVTERVLAQEALRKSEEKHRRILETAAEGFIMMDAGLRLVYCNEAYAAMLGYAPEELVGRSPLEWTTPESRAFLQAHRKRLLAQERRSFEGALVARDGTVVPVLVHGNTLRDADGNFLNHIAFVTNISEQKKALALAEEVQRSLLPTAPPVRRGLEVAGRMTPSESIGGDYFDYFDLPSSYPGWLGVVVGDIAGHGVDAALLMTTARAFLRQRVQRPGELAEMMMDLNRALVQDMAGSGRFMTCFQLLIDCCVQDAGAMGRLHWVRAGHDPALLYDPEADTFTELDGPGLPLGILDDFPFESRQLDNVRPGMLIAVGTDGIWEAMDAQGQLYGKERFKNVLRRHSQATATDIVDAVFLDVGQFCQGVRFQDDVTLVIIKLVGTAPHA